VHLSLSRNRPTTDFLTGQPLPYRASCKGGLARAAGPHDKEHEVATLLLTSRNAPPAIDSSAECPSLRAWLRKDWAILFSHPDDFVRCDLEMDRWLAVIQRAFAGCRIRPLALASPTLEGHDGWVAQVTGDARTVLLEEPSRENVRAFDLGAHALHHDIRSLAQRRFVMIIDDTLRSRRTFCYSGLASVPSPLEFLGWADAARGRHGTGEEKLSAATAHPAHTSVMRHHRHRPTGLACSTAYAG
jgi:alkyl hydroperoxide reductase subunit AhpC